MRLAATLSKGGCLAAAHPPHPFRVRQITAAADLEACEVLAIDFEPADAGEWCCELSRRIRLFLPT
jgi:hypothetical protein